MVYGQYKKLEKNILAARMDIRLLETKIDKLLKSQEPSKVSAVSYDNLSVDGSMKYKDANLKTFYQELAIATGTLRIVKEYLYELEVLKKEFDEELKQLIKKYNDLEMEVFYLHHINKKPLIEISDSLNYSYSHIKRINLQIINKIKNDDTKMIPCFKKGVI